MRRVVIDPGHGGFDPGAVGPGGTREKDVTLAVSKLLATYLSPILNVKLLRTEDRSFGDTVTADLRGRVAMAEQFGADVYLSIHCNSAASPSARGTEVYTTPGRGKADQLAEAIIQAWNKEFPEMVIRKDLRDGDSDKEANFYVLRKTSMPAVLVEMGFISNPQEEKLLRDAAWQERAARAIARGTASYLNLKAAFPGRFIVLDASDCTGFVGNKMVKGFLKDGRIWVQAREVVEALGHTIIYYSQTKSFKVF